jgi:hypothetical protein
MEGKQLSIKQQLKNLECIHDMCGKQQSTQNAHIIMKQHS